jgi:hypothetical protein
MLAHILTAFAISKKIATVVTVAVRTSQSSTNLIICSYYDTAVNRSGAIPVTGRGGLKVV